MGIILNLIGAIITIFFGLWALVQPAKFARAISLTPYKESGITEIRATYGGWILGLSVFTAINQHELLFYCLGFGWLGAGIVRAVAMTFIDNSFSKKNLYFVFIELFVCVLLMI